MAPPAGPFSNACCSLHRPCSPASSTSRGTPLPLPRRPVTLPPHSTRTTSAPRLQVYRRQRPAAPAVLLQPPPCQVQGLVTSSASTCPSPLPRLCFVRAGRRTRLRSPASTSAKSLPPASCLASFWTSKNAAKNRTRTHRLQDFSPSTSTCGLAKYSTRMRQV